MTGGAGRWLESHAPFTGLNVCGAEGTADIRGESSVAEEGTGRVMEERTGGVVVERTGRVVKDGMEAYP